MTLEHQEHAAHRRFSWADVVARAVWRRRIEKPSPKALSKGGDPATNGDVTLQAKGGKYAFERFTESAKQLLVLAQEEAELALDAYIGTEHLLLAAMRRPEFSSARVLAALGVQEAAVRAAIFFPGRKKGKGAQPLIPTTWVRNVITSAFELSGSEEDHPEVRVHTYHMLLGLAMAGEGIAFHVLNDLGATRVRLEAEIRKLPEPEP